MLLARPFDNLSDELLDCIVTECGANSLAVCTPRVAHRWTAASLRALASLVHISTRFVPMRDWPLELKPGGVTRHCGEFVTRAQLLAKGGDDQAKSEDVREAERADEQLNDFLPDAFKLGYLNPPEPLRLVRVGDKLLKCTSDDYEEAFEQPFHESDEDNLTTLVKNISHILSKTKRLERLEIFADLWYLDHSTDGIPWVHRLLPLHQLPAASLKQLRELSVYGKMYTGTALTIANLCPNLTKLAYDTFIEGMSGPGMHIGFELELPGNLEALRALKVGCPKLTAIPLLELHSADDQSGATNKQVDELFSMLREWPSLQKVLLLSGPRHPRVMRNAESFEGNRGAFQGKLSVECLYIEEAFDMFKDGNHVLIEDHSRTCAFARHSSPSE